MPGGVGGAVQAAKFAGGLGVAATRAGRCLPGVPIAGTGQRGPVCLLVWVGLIVCVVAAAPGGACGWLPARAAARCGSCWHGAVVVPGGALSV